MGGLKDRIVVFAGPSLAAPRRPDDPRLAWRPPAVAGDACELFDAGARAVVLIDGLFDQTLAIRHKELLGLIARGVPVIGGASMGALRAAELDVFGMVGVGRIYAAFASGRLDGDDEVAVLHGPAELDWPSMTEPLINIRATALRAAHRRVIDSPLARRLIQAAQAMFYKERTWESLLGAMSRTGAIDPASRRALEAWLPGGYLNLKEIDALACLEAALAVDPAAMPRRPFPPDTLFSDALASQVARGVRPR